MIEPDLLLLDEPLGALDKQLRIRMQSELKDLQRSLGITAVFVTHDQEEAVAMADRIVVMRGGEIQQVAAPDALFLKPANAWVADFIDAGNLVSGPVTRGTEGLWSIRLADHATLSAPAPHGMSPEKAVLLIPQHRLTVERSASGSPFVVSSLQPSGMIVTVQIRGPEGLLRAQLPVERMADLAVGAAVEIGTVPDGGLWLAER